MIEPRKLLNILDLIAICGILLLAFYIQFFWHEEPCPLCLLQRLGMIGIGIGMLMNVKFGVSSKHYALDLLAALFGASVAIRQILLHIVPGEPAFGSPIFGLHLYTWSFIGFAAMIFYIAILLFLGERSKA